MLPLNVKTADSVTAPYINSYSVIGYKVIMFLRSTVTYPRAVCLSVHCPLTYPLTLTFGGRYVQGLEVL